MGSWILASSRIAVGTQPTSCALVIESPLANSVTSCPIRTNSSVRYETIRSVPPYSRGGTLSMSGATCPIFIFTVLAIRGPRRVRCNIDPRPKQSLYRNAHFAPRREGNSSTSSRFLHDHEYDEP